MNSSKPYFDPLASSALKRYLENEDPNAARNALHRPRKDPRDLALLLSPGAGAILEEMAQAAKRITVERFGKVVQLYAPLYLTNYCVGKCPYCGFNKQGEIVRRTLTLPEIIKEAGTVAALGIRHLLLVAGDYPKAINASFLKTVVVALRRFFPSVSVEVAPLKNEEYRALVDAGADGVTLYQETYDRREYTRLHQRGPKADYDFRLSALDRAGEAGMRKLTVGALLGLAPWRNEGLQVGLHAGHLQKSWWRSQIQIGLPRLHQVPDGFEIPHPMDDRSFVQLIIALRLFLSDVGLVLSTREQPELRDQLIGLGITTMSAGSKTEPGGYSAPEQTGQQFEVTDHRSPTQVASAVLAKGYDPVWKDWDYALGVRHD